MIDALTRSLSFRLLAIFVLLAAAFIIGSTYAIRWIYSEDDLRELISGHLSLHVDYVRQDIGDPPNTERALAITDKVPVDIRIVGPAFDWASDANFPAMSSLEFGQSDIFSEEPGAWLNELQNVEFAIDGYHRFLKLEQGMYEIIVSTPRISDPPTAPPLIPVIVLIGLVWLLLAYLSVRWLFSPVESIRIGAEKIGAGELEHRIVGYRNDQLGDLAQDVNRLAGDVRAMLDAKRQLLLGISHELRTPLSRLRLALEFVADSDEKASLRAEIAEMENIIAALLEAERLNERHALLNRTHVHIRDLIEQLIENYFSRDRQKIRVDLHNDDLVADVDDARIMLLLKNLIGNALRYSSGDDESIVVQVDANGDDLVIAVTDDGPGFAPEQRDKIGEPFFRGDPSRARHTGGTGLGLYLTMLVAEAHGGTLVLDDEWRDGRAACGDIARLREARGILGAIGRLAAH